MVREGAAESQRTSLRDLEGGGVSCVECRGVLVASCVSAVGMGVDEGVQDNIRPCVACSGNLSVSSMVIRPHTSVSFDRADLVLGSHLKMSVSSGHHPLETTRKKRKRNRHKLAA